MEQGGTEQYFNEKLYSCQNYVIQDDIKHAPQPSNTLHEKKYFKIHIET